MGIFEAVSAPVTKMSIMSIDDPRRALLDVQFNPTEFTESIGVNYNRQQVPGLSHEVLQYVNTTNDAIQMELFFDADDSEQLERNLQARKFLMSVCYPRRIRQQVIGGGPPRLLFIWPTLISLTTVILGVTFTYTRFSNSGQPLDFTANFGLEEIRDFRLLSDDVLELGSIRGPDAPGGSSRGGLR